MAISTYAELQTAVANWLNRGDLTTRIVEFITLGEARIYRDLRIRAMETALSDTIASGVVSVPSDYLELKYAYIDGSPTQFMSRMEPNLIYEKYPTRSSSGKPAFIGREGANFIFGPYPDSSYTVKGIYYAKLTALSDSNTTNWFTSNAPDLLLYATLLAAEPYLKNDPRIAVWENEYMKVKEAIQKQDNDEQFSGGGLAMGIV